jgi:hypothetical protein
MDSDIHGLLCPVAHKCCSMQIQAQHLLMLQSLTRSLGCTTDLQQTQADQHCLQLSCSTL